ncbi:hypothetical protein BROUX41_001907 [Berkeleyomyces rouxiae]|uniref:uncharacterized protein n=1 Tax=Berkeleyomyces rouxiae TaxID=2035830 RepID=UPI003B7641BB
MDTVLPENTSGRSSFNLDTAIGSESGSAPTSISSVSDSNFSSNYMSPCTTPTIFRLKALLPWEKFPLLQKQLLESFDHNNNTSIKKLHNYIYFESPAQKLVNKHMTSVKLTCRVAAYYGTGFGLPELPFPVAEKLWVKTRDDCESAERCIWGLAIQPEYLPRSSIKKALDNKTWVKFTEHFQSHISRCDTGVWKNADLPSVLIKAYEGMYKTRCRYGYIATCEAIIFLSIPDLTNPDTLLFHVHIPQNSSSDMGKIKRSSLRSLILNLASFLLHVVDSGSGTMLGQSLLSLIHGISSPVTPLDKIQDGTFPRVFSSREAPLEEATGCIVAESPDSNSDIETVTESVLNDKLQAFPQSQGVSIIGTIRQTGLAAQE